MRDSQAQESVMDSIQVLLEKLKVITKDALVEEDDIKQALELIKYKENHSMQVEETTTMTVR